MRWNPVLIVVVLSALVFSLSHFAVGDGKGKKKRKNTKQSKASVNKGRHTSSKNKDNSVVRQVASSKDAPAGSSSSATSNSKARVDGVVARLDAGKLECTPPNHGKCILNPLKSQSQMDSTVDPRKVYFHKSREPDCSSIHKKVYECFYYDDTHLVTLSFNGFYHAEKKEVKYMASIADYVGTIAGGLEKSGSATNVNMQALKTGSSSSSSVGSSASSFSKKSYYKYVGFEGVNVLEEYFGADRKSLEFLEWVQSHVQTSVRRRHSSSLAKQQINAPMKFVSKAAFDELKSFSSSSGGTGDTEGEVSPVRHGSPKGPPKLVNGEKERHGSPKVSPRNKASSNGSSEVSTLSEASSKGSSARKQSPKTTFKGVATAVIAVKRMEVKEIDDIKNDIDISVLNEEAKEVMSGLTENLKELGEKERQEIAAAKEAGREVSGERRLCHATAISVAEINLKSGVSAMENTEGKDEKQVNAQVKEKLTSGDNLMGNYVNSVVFEFVKMTGVMNKKSGELDTELAEKVWAALQRMQAEGVAIGPFEVQDEWDAEQYVLLKTHEPPILQPIYRDITQIFQLFVRAKNTMRRIGVDIAMSEKLYVEDIKKELQNSWMQNVNSIVNQMSKYKENKDYDINLLHFPQIEDTLLKTRGLTPVLQTQMKSHDWLTGYHLIIAQVINLEIMREDDRQKLQKNFKGSSKLLDVLSTWSALMIEGVSAQSFVMLDQVLLPGFFFEIAQDSLSRVGIKTALESTFMGVLDSAVISAKKVSAKLREVALAKHKARGKKPITFSFEDLTVEIPFRFRNAVLQVLSKKEFDGVGESGTIGHGFFTNGGHAFKYSAVYSTLASQVKYRVVLNAQSGKSETERVIKVFQKDPAAIFSQSKSHQATVVTMGDDGRWLCDNPKVNDAVVTTVIIQKVEERLGTIEPEELTKLEAQRELKANGDYKTLSFGVFWKDDGHRKAMRVGFENKRIGDFSEVVRKYKDGVGQTLEHKQYYGMRATIDFGR